MEKASSLMLLNGCHHMVALDAHSGRAKIMLEIFLVCLYSTKLLLFTRSFVVICASLSNAHL